MKHDTILKVEGVSKKFCKTLKKSMVYGMSDITRNVFGLKTRSDRLREDEFWAVDDLSFELKRGETLGIIGSNGSGKSTILKMINGIYWPDRGKITVKGRVGALIEVGAGFHPMLTGRENIYINGAILGMNRQEINQKFDEIVDFADIGEFLETPVKHYSSGMFVRLGFAIAVHCEPDLLLVDEILAVGDIDFRSRCYNKIAEIVNNSALIIVSHDIYNLYRWATNTMVMDKGKKIFNGASELSVLKYLSTFQAKKSIIKSNGIRLTKAELLTRLEDGILVVDFNRSLDVVVKLISDVEFAKINFIMTFVSSTGEFVAEWNSWLNNSHAALKKGPQDFKLSLHPIRLNAGIYQVSLVITSENLMEHLLILHSHWRIKVVSHALGKGPYQIEGRIVGTS